MGFQILASEMVEETLESSSDGTEIVTEDLSPLVGEMASRGLSGLRLSEFVQISEFFSIYITDICQTSESFPKSVNLK